MKKLFLMSLVMVLGLSACVQNSKPKPKVGDKKFYDVIYTMDDTIKKLSLVVEIMDVTDSTVTSSQTYTYLDSGEIISNLYTSKIEGEYTELPLKSLFAKHLASFGDNLEIVEGSNTIKYLNDMSESTTLEPARLVLKAVSDTTEVMIELAVKDRNVYGSEKITIPVGTFDCVKFSETHIAEIGDNEIFTKITCWYDKDSNLLRQTDSSKDGKVYYEVILTKME